MIILQKTHSSGIGVFKKISYFYVSSIICKSIYIYITVEVFYIDCNIAKNRKDIFSGFPYTQLLHIREIKFFDTLFILIW